MKKSLLFCIAAGFGLYAMAQNNGNPTVIPGPVKNNTMPYSKNSITGTADIDLPFSSVYTPANQKINPTPVYPAAFTPVVIATTGYQLQTNSSIRNGIVRNSDGTISLGVTWSNQTSAWSDRGTGYLYHNGTAWSAAPTARVESSRTGWPSIAVTASGKEHFVSHNTASSTLQYTSRPVKGTGTWTEDLILLTGPTAGGNWWPRLTAGGANGNSLHLISLTYPVANGGTMHNGQDGALTYSRSTDDGATWPNAHVVPTQHDSAAGYSGFGGDAYSIDARGDVVAYVVGDFTNDVFLMKSTDNGTTWNKTIIHDFPIPYFLDQLSDTNGDMIADTLYVCDGSLEVLIDNNNMAHVWFGQMRIINDDTTDGNVSYFPVTDGLYYWNESMGANNPQVWYLLEDIDQSGTFDLPTPATSGYQPFGIYQVSMTSFPTASIDATGRIILIYSAVIENTDNGSGKAFRNLYAMGTLDGGANWTTPIRFASDDFVDQAFPDAARNFVNCVPLYYTEDQTPGHGTTGQPATEDPQSGPTDVKYGCLLATDVFASVNEIENSMFTIGQNYPNPTNGTTEIGLNMKKAGKLSIDVYNTLGEKVAVIANGNFQAGEHIFTFDASVLPAGVYYYTVTAGGFSATKKMIVQ
ncbi:MAG: T9SS type A sorting domain-containing protein [Bacteroidota bacterium]